MPLATLAPQTPKDSEALESRQKMLYLLLFGLALSKDGNITLSEMALVMARVMAPGTRRSLAHVKWHECERGGGL